MSRLSIAIVAAVLGIIAAGSLFFIYDSLSAPAVVVAPATLSLSRPMTINIIGEVSTPGTYQLGADGRLADAIAAAGGLTENADQARFNPARRLTDAEQIDIPGVVPPTPPPAPTMPSSPTPPAAANNPTPTPATTAQASASGLININTADAAALDSLPGIGPAIAQRISDYRTEHGPFATVDELARVNGISAAMVDELRPMITVGE